MVEALERKVVELIAANGKAKASQGRRLSAAKEASRLALEAGLAELTASKDAERAALQLQLEGVITAKEAELGSQKQRLALAVGAKAQAEVRHREQAARLEAQVQQLLKQVGSLQQSQAAITQVATEAAEQHATGQALLRERLDAAEAAKGEAERRLAEATAAWQAEAAAAAARLAAGAGAAGEELRLGREREVALMGRIELLKRRVQERQEAVRCARDEVKRMMAIWARARLGKVRGRGAYTLMVRESKGGVG